MKKSAWLVGVVVLGLTAQVVCGAALPGSITRDTLLESYSLARWSVGANVELLDRDIKFNGDLTTLEAQCLSLFLGYDVLPYLTVYGTLGGVKARPERADDWGSTELKTSLGVNLNLWQYEITDPSFMAGLLTVKTTMEVGWYGSDYKDFSYEWREFVWAFPVGYELHERDAETIGGLDISLALYVAPALSTISGHASGGVDFEEDESTGIIAGADIFLARNVSLGLQIQQFGSTSVAGAFRYHF